MKAGFIAQWFRQGKLSLKRLVDFDKIGSRGLVNIDFIKWMEEEHIKGKHDWSHQLFMILVLEFWFQIFYSDFKF
mgnify:CR=1 FL=1